MNFILATLLFSNLAFAQRNKFSSQPVDLDPVAKNEDCPEGYKMVEETCIFESGTKMTWNDAQAKCYEAKGFLLEPRTEKDFGLLSNDLYHLGVKVVDSRLTYASNLESFTLEVNGLGINEFKEDSQQG